MILAFVFVIISFFSGGSAESNFEMIAAGLGVIVVIPAVIRYFTFGYAISQGNLLIKSGLLTINTRTIPLDRIQNINLSRSIFHRLLGLVDLDIETASGSKAEASISALTEEQAKILKAQLMRQAPKLTSIINEERNKVVIYKPSFYELFLAGASENRLAAILAAVAGLNIFGQNTIENFVERHGKNIVQFQNVNKNVVLVGAIAFAGLMLVGWITSIVGTFFKYYGFELTEEGEGRVKRSYGLFHQIENVLPLKRIQAVVYQQNPLQRWLKISKLFVSTAGQMGHAKKSEEGQVQVAQSPLLTPVLKQESYKMLLKLVLPQYEPDEETRYRISKATIFRHVRSGIMISLILAGVSIPFIKWGAAGVFASLLLLHTLAGWLYYRNAYYSDSNDIIMSGHGWFTHRQFFLPTNKVQAVTVRQSPAQRALKLASVDFASAAPTFQSTVIEDGLVENIAELAQSVHQRSRSGRDSLLDGF